METNISTRPRPGEIYRHFKNKLYQIITVATHSETREEMVVYQALYGDFKSYVRPLSMFCSAVDKVKYPTAVQKYRFELINREIMREDQQINTVKDSDSNTKLNFEMHHKEEHNDNLDGFINPDMLKFLDAESYSEKLEIFLEMKKNIDERTLSDISISLDVVLNDGSLEERIESIRSCLETYTKFEYKRFR